jgi:hypothetical protein
VVWKILFFSADKQNNKIYPGDLVYLRHKVRLDYVRADYSYKIKGLSEEVYIQKDSIDKP